jgi:ribosomal protein S8
MAYRKPNAAFLETMVELCLRLGTIRAVLENDDVLAALANTGFNRVALEDMARKIAQPSLVSLLEFLRDQYFIALGPDGHEEHRTTISLLIRSIDHVITGLTDESQPGDLRRYAANYNLGRYKTVVGLAIRSEIGAMTDEAARANRIATKQAGK